MGTNRETHQAFVSVFKGYLDTALTANIWLYALTGAVVTYYLTHRVDNPYLIFSLAFPPFLGGLIIYLSCNGIKRAEELESSMLEEEYEPKPEPLLKFLKRLIRSNDVRKHKPPVNFLLSFLKASILLICLVSVIIFILFIVLFCDFLSKS